MTERPDFETVRAILARKRRTGVSFEQVWQVAGKVDGPYTALGERS
ncbi:MAG TPA: hypothetical protein VLJ80_09680 [Solirubrobacteraceae bacterium]|nr:hypothetical protein [Solirubrobacteraceae bacterium]